MAAWIKMSLDMKLGLGQGDFVLDGDHAPPPQKGEPPKFSAHVYCGKTAGWMKLVLGMTSDQSTLYYMGTQPPSKKGAEPPNFQPMFIAAKRLD